VGGVKTDIFQSTTDISQSQTDVSDCRQQEIERKRAHLARLEQAYAHRFGQTIPGPVCTVSPYKHSGILYTPGLRPSLRADHSGPGVYSITIQTQWDSVHTGPTPIASGRPPPQSEISPLQIDFRPPPMFCICICNVHLLGSASQTYSIAIQTQYIYCTFG
jgi:hypothetical protein